EDITTMKTMPHLIDLIFDSHANDLEKVRQITPLFLKMSEASDRLLVEYPLEEVTIEAMLQDRVDTGELTYVPTKSYANATWYIQYSIAMASNFYEEMDNLYSRLRRMATSTGAMREYGAL